ncbi:ribonuclease E/G [Altererythrobacter sp. ZODW24]|uniref:ribonuclease E/G n=1 Tax=Altererythrobacter sp. ZODW24 TaxID=2185142 RepID=UPI000DF83C19|nr:ribonuclease E/G [Altererythrobacter sp. ZODW24]
MTWYVEAGIGEARAIEVVAGQIVAARLDWPGGLVAGQIEDATLISRKSGSKRGTARFASGAEALVDRLQPDASEGAPIRLEVIRSSIAERGRLKLAHARPTNTAVRPSLSLVDRLIADGRDAKLVRRFPIDGWDELFAEAWDQEISFSGGSLAFSQTPAMLLIDVDGDLPAHALALAAVAPLAEALRRFDCGGSIGIDFPTLQHKDHRKAVDDALAKALKHWPHERTAMNGFGFVHLVARLKRPSLLNLVTISRVGAAARLLLRRAEAVTEPGALLLTAHPGVRAKLKDEWLEELARRTGREIRLESDPKLAIGGGFAQGIAL